MTKLVHFPSAEAALTYITHLSTIDRTLVEVDGPNLEDFDVVVDDSTDAPWVVFAQALVPVNDPVFYRNGTCPGLTGSQRLIRSYQQEAELRRRQEFDRARRRQIKQAIADHLGPRGTMSEVGDVLVDGRPCYHFEIKENRTTGSSFHSKPTGQYSVSVGDFGNRKSFPERKDGTHNYIEIARMVLRSVDEQIERLRSEVQRTQNQLGLGELRKELKFLSVYPSSSADKPVRVSFKIDREMTVDDLRRLDAALAAWAAGE